jgi:hypothetical protein
MKELIELTEQFAKRILDIENQRKKIGEFLRDLNSKVEIQLGTDTFENKIFIPVLNNNLENKRIAGVDGGLVKHSLHGMDIMLLRAIGVIFNFKNNKLENVDYYPDALPSPIPYVLLDPFSDIEFEINSNMTRQTTETTVARETIEKFSPDVLLLNGSVVPHYTERPAEHSLLFSTYTKMIDSYKQLIKNAKEKGRILAGVIEDSRGTRFSEVVNQKLVKDVSAEAKLLLNRTKDSNLLSYALQLNERTLVFKYSSNPENHPILKEFGTQIANQIFTLYLKTAEFDRPIRIDFFTEKNPVEIANKISSILLSLTGHSGYGMPSVLIEADQRAKLSEKDLETFYLDLINKAGNIPGLFNLRRNQRPF